jgi:putative endonuclease
VSRSTSLRGRWSSTGAGRRAEKAAEKWLEAEGYRIVDRNVRNGGGELDLVAEEGDTLCFIEVKSRRSTDYGRAVATVGRDKRRRIVRAASLYVAMLRAGERPIRFDVLGMEGGEGRWRFDLVRGAFQADSD